MTPATLEVTVDPTDQLILIATTVAVDFETLVWKTHGELYEIVKKETDQLAKELTTMFHKARPLAL